jgi:Tfp pilus assembly protein PilX
MRYEVMKMQKLSLQKRGSVIITVLFIAVILLMYATALVSINQHNMRVVRMNHDRIAAQQMAEAGVNNIIHTIFYNSNFGKYNEVLEYTSTENPELGYRITFNPDHLYYSVNNLDNKADSYTKNFEGKRVASETIDIYSPDFITPSY